MIRRLSNLVVCLKSKPRNWDPLPEHLHLEQQTIKKAIRAKNCYAHVQLGQSIGNKTKGPRAQRPLLRCWEQKQGAAHDPSRLHNELSGQTTIPLPNPQDLPSCDPFKDGVPLWDGKGACFWFSSPGCITSRHKALPEILIWRLIISID